MKLGGPPGRPFAGLAVLILAAAGCTGYAPTPGPPEFPLVPCALDGPAPPTAPAGFELVAPGTIAFGWDTWHNVSGSNTACGAQAVRGARSVIPFPSLGGEDTISWAATLAWPGQPSTPDPILPTMSLFRLDPGGPVLVQTMTGRPTEQYRMMGNYGHDATPGSYLMRILSGSGNLLAEGRFEIAN